MAITRRIAIASEYQQTREQRIQQNLDRFQKLGIVDLCLKLKPKRTPKPFKSPSLGPTQPRRRSSRLQNPPPVSKRSSGIVVEEGANPEFDTEENDGLAKVGMPAEDPNKPKRPPCAFFVFMEDFRVEYKQKHPDNKSVAAVGKAGGEKWKSMSDAEKAPYIEEVEKRKADYEKTMSAYKKSLELVPNAQMVVVRGESCTISLGQPVTELCFEKGGHEDRVKDSIQVQTSHHHQGTPSISAGSATDRGTAGMVRESETSGREDFRVHYKQIHPDNKSVATVGKAAGEIWKSMSDAEKAPYQCHGWLPFPPPFLETSTAALEYEQIKEQRIKQNHDRFKELGIVDLSLQLKPRRTPKPSNHRITPSLGPAQPRRRSFRLENPPPVPKRSRDNVLEEGTKSEFCTQEHDGLAVRTCTAKMGMPTEDPDKPKRPASSAFFVFLEDFRVQYKPKHPGNKSFVTVAKAAGEKWRSMSEAEKAPYIEKYIEKLEIRKADYEKNMSAYRKRLAEGSQDEREDESDKSRCDIKDENGDNDSGKEVENDD